MAYGNAIGSIICNTALIAAISAAAHPGPVNARTLTMPVIFFFVSAAVYCFAAYILGRFPRWLGLILLGIFALYLFVTVRQGLTVPAPTHEEEEADTQKKRALWHELLLLVGGAAVIAAGADLLVDHGTILARELGVPEAVIALTFVALGTSLPELITTVTSLRKGHASLGLGNVIGANIFNLVLVSGASVALAPFRVPVGNTLFGINSSLVLDIPLMVAVMTLLTLPVLLRGKLSRWQGITLLAIYAAFCALQFAL
jgi:cation:H+ antiporter